MACRGSVIEPAVVTPGPWCAMRLAGASSCSSGLLGSVRVRRQAAHPASDEGAEMSKCSVDAMLPMSDIISSRLSHLAPALPPTAAECWLLLLLLLLQSSAHTPSSRPGWGEEPKVTFLGACGAGPTAASRGDGDGSRVSVCRTTASVRPQQTRPISPRDGISCAPVGGALLKLILSYSFGAASRPRPLAARCLF
jgi:hypothetical protein